MGQLATRAGLSCLLFDAARACVGHRRGGLAVATIGGCGGFGAVCGSSLATAATMGSVALPEMRRYGYSGALATGNRHLVRRHGPDRRRDRSALQAIREFMVGFASRSGWDERMEARLDAVSEETLLTLLDEDEDTSGAAPRRLLVVARREDGGATLEFVALRGEENLQDQIAVLGEASAGDVLEREVSLRLLRHLASSVRHQQYHDTDVVTVRVEPPEASTANDRQGHRDDEDMAATRSGAGAHAR